VTEEIAGVPKIFILPLIFPQKLAIRAPNFVIPEDNFPTRTKFFDRRKFIGGPGGMTIIELFALLWMPLATAHLCLLQTAVLLNERGYKAQYLCGKAAGNPITSHNSPTHCVCL